MTRRGALFIIWFVASLVIGLNLHRNGLNDISTIVAAVIWLVGSTFAICVFFGRAATAGGPEHRDPNEAEIKAAKGRHQNEYFVHSTDDELEATRERYKALRERYKALAERYKQALDRENQK